MFRTFPSAVALALWLAAGPLQAQAPLETLVQDAIANLDWQLGAGRYILSSPNATIHTGDDEGFLQGADAHEFVRLSEGHTLFRPDAVVLKLDGPLSDSFVMYTYNEVGYVRMDDWAEHIDPSRILAEIKKQTAHANKVRTAGYSKIHVDRWAEEPHLDRSNAIVYWAVEGHSDNADRFVNAKALKLGRKGMSELIWVGSPQQFQAASESLRPALEAYMFNEGYRYADFRPGLDAVAAVGIGAIAYKMLTGSNKKGAAAGAGILAIIAALAKKLWILIFLPFVFAWRFIKDLFNRKDPL